MGSVKGQKKDWILSEVYLKFVEQFLSDQNGGPQLQSLQEVSCLLWYSILAEIVVENAVMVSKSPPLSGFWLRFKSTTYHTFSATSQHLCAINSARIFADRAQGKDH